MIKKGTLQKRVSKRANLHGDFKETRTCVKKEAREGVTKGRGS